MPKFITQGYGATVARETPDQKVGSSNLSALTLSPSPGATQMLLDKGAPGFEPGTC